ncbi:PAS domain-containing protein [Sulfurospirillum sp. 1612]|uniref:PAS domain-containing protein n=1 Tax=Sulfurospirillum sp. 1612 TaxID=3094835 RepID=UPI002F957975
MKASQTFIETPVPQDELIISRTDLNGKITYANKVFADISGYEPEELIGKSHNIIRHPDMPKSVFKALWETIKSKKMWSGYVKNMRKDGGYYWVYAEVSPLYKDGKIIEYKSMRTPISDEKKIEIQKKYDAMRASEEGSVRIVANISTENDSKLMQYAADKKISKDAALDSILGDYLL